MQMTCRWHVCVLMFVYLAVRPSTHLGRTGPDLIVCMSVRPSVSQLDRTGPDWLFVCLSVRPPIWAGPDRIKLVIPIAIFFNCGRACEIKLIMMAENIVRCNRSRSPCFRGDNKAQSKCGAAASPGGNGTVQQNQYDTLGPASGVALQC